MEEEGLCCESDVTRFVIILMQRLGRFCMSELDVGEIKDCSIEYMETCGEKEIILENGIPKEGRMRVRVDALGMQLFGLHGILTLLWMTTNAKPVPHNVDVDLHGHHREASLDQFYEASMVGDLGPGQIIQYRSKFSHLFHSISQVIFFNHPQYHRQKQIPMEEIVKGGCSAVNVLPLLLQIAPEIPLLYEHTGACCKQVHEGHAFAWVLLSGFILLVDRAGVIWCARDIRSLLLKAKAKNTRESL